MIYISTNHMFYQTPPIPLKMDSYLTMSATSLDSLPQTPNPTELQTVSRSDLYDTIIYCRSKEFKVQKAILIAASPYFKNLLINSANETEIDKIYMDSFQPDALMQVFHFMYNNPLQLNETNIQSVMQTARSLEINMLYNQCTSQLQSQLSHENFIEMWNIADLFSDNDLRSAVIRYCVENYLRLRNKKIFLTLSRQRLQKVLQDSNLNATGHQLIETIIEWIRLGQPEKQQEMTEMLYILRSDIASKHYLQRLNHDQSLLQDTPALRQLLHTVLQTRQIKEVSPKPPYNYSSSFYDDSQKPPTILSFIENEKKQTVVQLTQMNGEIVNKKPRLSPFEVRHAGTVVYSDRIYCAGGRGFHSTTPFLTTFCWYDVMTDDVNSLAFMTTPRAQLALAVHEGNIYAIGGYNIDGELSDVEKYSIDDDSWSVVTPMITPRRGVASVSFAGRLYAVGGRKKMETLVNVEYYTTNSDQWTEVASMLYPRTNCSVTFLNDKLYVCGGFWSIREFIKSNVGNVQVYDCNNDRWDIGISLKTSSLITSAFSWQEKLYLFSASGYVLVYFVTENIVERVRQVSFPNGLVRCAFPVTNRSGLRSVRSLFSFESMWSLSNASQTSKEDEDIFQLEETRL